MPDLLEIGEHRVFVCDQQGEFIDSRQRGLDVTGDALGLGATVAAIPTVRLGKAFFDLRTGIAGEITQAAVNYRLKLAAVGDISEYVAESNAVRDWVSEPFVFCHEC